MDYEGIEVVVRLYHEIDLTNLNGTFVMCPIQNMPGFEQGVPYLNPLDGKNLNRVYPGNSTISGQIVHVAFNEIIRLCELMRVRSLQNPTEACTFECL